MKEFFDNIFELYTKVFFFRMNMLLIASLAMLAFGLVALLILQLLYNPFDL